MELVLLQGPPFCLSLLLSGLWVKGEKVNVSFSFWKNSKHCVFLLFMLTAIMLISTHIFYKSLEESIYLLKFQQPIHFN